MGADDMRGRRIGEITSAHASWRCRFALITLLVFGLTTGVAATATEEYARPELLAEAAWLAQHLDDSDLRIVDMRSWWTYWRGHIPGAVHLHWRALKDPDAGVHVIPADKLATFTSDLGVGNETTVVGYDDQGGLFSTWLWWVLDYFGHTKVKVLNGGWNTWVKEHLPITTNVPALQPTQFTVRADPSKICLIDALLADLKRPYLAIVDARTPAEYNGSHVQADHGGHMPGAINIDWIRNITNNDMKTFRPAAELLKMYEAAGVTKDKEIVTYCQAAFVQRLQCSR